MNEENYENRWIGWFGLFVRVAHMNVGCRRCRNFMTNVYEGKLYTISKGYEHAHKLVYALTDDSH